MASVVAEYKNQTLSNGAYQDVTIGTATVLRFYVRKGLLKVYGSADTSGNGVLVQGRHDADYQDVIVSGMGATVRVQEASNGARGTTIPGLTNKAIYTLEAIIP